MFLARLRADGVLGESREDWTAGIAAALDFRRTPVAGPVARARWRSPAGPNVSETDFRAYCDARGLDADAHLLEDMAPEAPTNLTVAGPDALVLSTRVCYGVDALQTPLRMPDGLHTGHALIFIRNVIAVGFATPERLLAFAAHAPVGASLLTAAEESVFIRFQEVPAVIGDEHDAEDGGLFRKVDAMIEAVRAATTQTKTKKKTKKKKKRRPPASSDLVTPPKRSERSARSEKSTKPPRKSEKPPKRSEKPAGDRRGPRSLF